MITDDTKKYLSEAGFTVDEVNSDGDNSYSVRITDINNDISVWIDVWQWQETDGDEKYLTWDWNKYIFSHWDEYDMRCKEYQENTANIETIAWVMDCIMDDLEVA